MANLELLVLRLVDNECAFSGLKHLQSIKEIRLRVKFTINFVGFPEDMPLEEVEKEANKKTKLVKEKLREEFRIQLDKNKNRPVLKVQ